MGNNVIGLLVRTDQDYERVLQTTSQAFRQLGGTQSLTSNGFQLIDGKYGIKYQMFVNIAANIVIRKVSRLDYELQVYINWEWSGWMWFFLIMGFLTGGLSLFLMIIYFLFDPLPMYRQTLDRARYLLETRYADDARLGYATAT